MSSATDKMWIVKLDTKDDWLNRARQRTLAPELMRADVWKTGGDGVLRPEPTAEDRNNCTTAYLDEIASLWDEWSDDMSSWS